MGDTGGRVVTGRAGGSLEDGLATAMRTEDGFANPAGWEFDMAPAVLAVALEMSLGFWHELQPFYHAARPLNTGI